MGDAQPTYRRAPIMSLLSSGGCAIEGIRAAVGVILNADTKSHCSQDVSLCITLVKTILLHASSSCILKSFWSRFQEGTAVRPYVVASQQKDRVVNG
jgi:hypothetical protein